MKERSVHSQPSVTEEDKRLLKLSDGSMQYLACVGITRNPTIPEERRQMFRELAVHLLETMQPTEKVELVGYIAWKSEIMYETRRGLIVE